MLHFALKRFTASLFLKQQGDGTSDSMPVAFLNRLSRYFTKEFAFGLLYDLSGVATLRACVATPLFSFENSRVMCGGMIFAL